MPGRITELLLGLLSKVEDLGSKENTKLVLPVCLLNELNSLTEPSKALSHFQAFLSRTKLKVCRLNGLPPLDEEVDITRFVNLRYIEIENVPIHMVKGLHALRPQLEFLSCYGCSGNYEDVFVGGEGNSQVWEELRTVSLGGNKIEILGTRMFTSTPWLQYLDLSNNRITDQQWSLETLNNLKHLNLSYNHLDSLPKLSDESYQKLEMLLLKHNYIEDISDIWQFNYLEHLDISYNLLDDTSTMSALIELNHLKKLNTEGNPISYHRNYRLYVCSCLSKKFALQPVLLDNVKLNKKELAVLGTRRCIHPYRTPRRQLPRSEDIITDVARPSRSSERSAGSFSKSLTSKKVPRIRDAIIVDADLIAFDDSEKVNAPVTPIKEGLPPEHLETKKQLEGLRERFGENQWLHSHAGSFVQDLLGLQKTPNLINSVLLQDNSGPAPADMDYSAVERSLMNVTGTSSDVFYTPRSAAANTPYTSLIESESASGQLQDGDTPHREVDTDKHNDEEAKKYEVLDLDENETDSDEPEDDDGEGVKTWVVQKVIAEDVQEMFLLLKEKELKEKHSLSGHTLTRWGLSTLQSCVKLTSQPVKVQLAFDTIRKTAQERIYIMEEEKDAQELLQRLNKVLESRPISEMNQAIFRCMKCSAIFTREIKATIYTPKDGGLAHCQACGSNLCIKINEDEQFPSNGKNVAITETKTGTSPETKMGTSPSQCSIASENDGCVVMGAAGSCLAVVADVHLTNQHEDNDSSYSAWSAASLDQSSRESPAGTGEGGSHGQSQTATPRRCDSDIEVISNPSQSSIEVIEVQARLQANGGSGTPNRKRSSEERQTVAVPQLVTVPEVQSGNTGLTESSSSGSLTDSICTTYENHAPLGKRLPSQGSAGAALVEETSAENSPSTAASVPCPPQQPTDGERSPLKSFHSLPNANYASLLENLLQDVSSKLEYPKQSDQDDSVQYSYMDLSMVDHRVKLFLYQGLFENEEEQLVLLIRATLVDKEGQTFPGCFVLSTCNCFILKVTGNESGDDASEFLQKEYAQAILKLQSITALPWLQGIRLAFEQSQYLLLIHDAQRTKQLFEFIKGVRSSLPERCTITDVSAVESNVGEAEHLLAIQHELLTSLTDRSSDNIDVDASLLHVSLPVTLKLSRDNCADEIFSFTAFGVTSSDLFLLTPNLGWMFQSSTSIPSLHTKQKMSNLIDLCMTETTLTLHFLDENEAVEETWLLSYPTPTSVTAIINAIKAPWELLFSVPLQVTIT